MAYAGKTRVAGDAASGIRFLENLAYLVPSYRGYKEKELRREEDSRLRSRVLAKLRVLQTLLDEQADHCTERELAPPAEALGGRVHRIEVVAEGVRYAPYGFSGFFDSDRVREEMLERLLEIDLLVLQDLDEAAEMLRDPPSAPAPRFSAFLTRLDESIERIEARLITRDKILGDF
jgi:hypothetical protein